MSTDCDYKDFAAERRARLETMRPYFENISGVSLTTIDGGYRVKETDTHYIEVMQKFFNWRIVTTSKACPLIIDRGWCYRGTDSVALASAVLAAMAWDGSDDTEPPGYFKRAGALVSFPRFQPNTQTHRLSVLSAVSALLRYWPGLAREPKKAC
jgi:hypothetical protein